MPCASWLLPAANWKCSANTCGKKKITIFISSKSAIYFLSIATLTLPSFPPLLNIDVIYPTFPALLKKNSVSITKYSSFFHIHSIIPFPFFPFHLHSASIPPLLPFWVNWLCRVRKRWGGWGAELVSVVPFSTHHMQCRQAISTGFLQGAGR